MEKKNFFLFTMASSASALVLMIAGYSNIVFIQWISAALLAISIISLFLMGFFMYRTLNPGDRLGRQIKILTHGLIVLIGLVPLFIGLLGLMASAGLYFMYPVTINASLLGQAMVITLLIIVLGYGILYSWFCYSRVDEIGT